MWIWLMMIKYLSEYLLSRNIFKVGFNKNNYLCLEEVLIRQVSQQFIF